MAAGYLDPHVRHLCCPVQRCWFSTSNVMTHRNIPAAAHSARTFHNTPDVFRNPKHQLKQHWLVLEHVQQIQGHCRTLVETRSLRQWCCGSCCDSRCRRCCVLRLETLRWLLLGWCARYAWYVRCICCGVTVRCRGVLCLGLCPNLHNNIL